MNRYLIAHYSRTGNTARIAETIAGKLPADLEPIRDVRPRPGAGGYFRSVYEAAFKNAPAIAPASRNAAEYEVVVLGCPVWAQNMASPMRSYILRERGRIRRMAVFCTEIGSGGEGVVRQMASLCGQPAIATLVLADRDLKPPKLDELIDGFVGEIRARTKVGEARPSAA
jgi:flavodoxin